MGKPVVAAEVPVAPDLAPEAAPEAEMGALGRVFRAFTYRNFRLLWFGAFTSSSGTWLQDTATAWLLYELTRDPFYLGLNGFLSTAPILLFTLVGGVMADRFDRRRILLTSQWSQLTFAMVLAALAFYQVSGSVLVFSVLCLSFLTGCAQAFGGPSYQSLIPMLVDKKDLPNAIALNSIQFQLARVVGSTISSFPFSIFNDQMIAAAVCYGINSFSFVAVIVALKALQIGHIPRSPVGGLGSQMREGLSFVWRQEGLRSLTFLAFASTFLGMQLLTFIAVFARDIFHTGARGNAVLMAISGAGAVTGALIIAGMGQINHKGRYALLMQIGFGLSIAAFTLAPSAPIAYPIVFIASIFMMCVFSLITSLVQLLVSDEMRGRVMSIFMVAFRGGMPLGSLATGLLVKSFPLPRVLMIEGLLLALLATAYLLSRSQVKEH